MRYEIAAPASVGAVTEFDTLDEIVSLSGDLNVHLAVYEWDRTTANHTLNFIGVASPGGFHRVEVPSLGF